MEILVQSTIIRGEEKGVNALYGKRGRDDSQVWGAKERG